MEKQHKITAISDDKFSPLEVEVMSFRHMPGKYAVSLSNPGNVWHTGRTRLINMSPQTALNLLMWLRERQQELELLAKEQQTSNSAEDEVKP